MKCTHVIPLFPALLLSFGANAQTINWVDFSSHPPSDLSSNNHNSTDGLSLDLAFENTANMRSTVPEPDTATVDDPTWPYDNDSIPAIFAISSPGNTLTSTLRFDFTNAGGLAPGGALGVIDLELLGSATQIRGFFGGQEVAVDWQVTYYKTAGEDAPPPTWDSGTATLSGTAGSNPNTINNFAFLKTNVQLDAIEIGITLVNGDGVYFAIASDLPLTGLRIDTAILLEFQSVVGESYTIEESVDLETWVDSQEDVAGRPVVEIQGDGSLLKFCFERTTPRKFYRLKGPTE